MTQPISTLTDFFNASQAFSNFNHFEHANWGLRRGPQHQVCAALGLTGEASEAFEVFLVLQARSTSIDSASVRTKFSKELGDVVWYIAQACDAHDIDIATLAAEPKQFPIASSVEFDMHKVVIEAGMHADYMKKCIYHGHPVDVAKVSETMRVVLAKVQSICTKVGFNFYDVLTENIAKLLARYPEGHFSTKRSVTRAAEA